VPPAESGLVRVKDVNKALHQPAVVGVHLLPRRLGVLALWYKNRVAEGKGDRGPAGRACRGGRRRGGGGNLRSHLRGVLVRKREPRTSNTRTTIGCCTKNTDTIQAKLKTNTDPTARASALQQFASKDMGPGFAIVRGSVLVVR